jgi:hypothetical protein
MIYLKYILLVPVNLLVTLLAIILSPVLPLFSADEYGWLNNGSKEGFGPRLPFWLGWFQTWDNSLDGDATFAASNPPSYLSKVKWIIRNPAPSASLRTLTEPFYASYKGDNDIKDNDNAKAGWVRVTATDTFQLAFIIPIGFSRCIYCNFGWNIRALVDDNVQPKPNPYHATFTFSPRISGYRP